MGPGIFILRSVWRSADYYEKIGEQAKRNVFLRQIADRTGYGEEKATRDACVRLGAELFGAGRQKKAESICGGRHNIRKQLAETSNLRNGLCRASNPNFFWLFRT